MPNTYNRDILERSSSSKKRQLRRMYRVYNGICQMCGVQTSFDDAWDSIPGGTYPTREHVIDLSISRDDDDSNVILACYECNMSKNRIGNLIRDCIDRQSRGLPQEELVGRPNYQELGITFEVLI